MNSCEQSCDNAASMYRKFKRVHANVKKENPFALHVSSAAVDSHKRVFYSFEFVQKLYNFFSKATHRWDMLRDILISHNLVMPKN